MREALAGLGILALLGGAYPLARFVRPTVAEKPAGMSREQSEALEEKAQASLFGQFRGSMSDFLYLQVDKYVHGGVDLRGMTAKEISRKERHVTSADGVETGTRQHDGTETTVVPDKVRDWRGVLGDMERNVKPYAPMAGHHHKDPHEALQIYRLMAAANPQSIRAYTEGGWLMNSVKGQGPEVALKFMEQGARANPESIEILSNIGLLLTRYLARYDAGRDVLERGVRIGESRDPATLTPDELTEFQNLFRYLVNNRKYARDLPAARRWARAGLKRFPGDVTCTKFLKDEAAGKQE